MYWLTCWDRNMNSKEIAKEIKKQAWPMLKERGFELFENHYTWRVRDGFTDVINFQSFGENQAFPWSLTPGSFAINLGCYVGAIPYEGHPNNRKKKKIKNKTVMLPHEHDCQLRRRLPKNFMQWQQPFSSKWWYVNKKGSNLESVVNKAVKNIEEIALPWFDQINSNEAVLNLVENREQSMDENWGWGNKESFIWHYNLGYLYLALGKYDTAIEHLEKALAKGFLNREKNENAPEYFSDIEKQIKDDVKKVRKKSS